MQQEDDVVNKPIPPARNTEHRAAHDEETTFFGFRKVPVRDKTKYVLRHFNSVAAKYDFMNTILSLGIHYIWKRQAVSSMRLNPGSMVIDVCGGTADLSILAARATGSGGRVILYDINRAMMQGGKPKVERASLNARIHFVQGDAETLSFPEGMFDAAMVGFGIRNVTRMGRGLSEMYRVLKPGGKFMCLEFSLPASPWFRALYDFYSFFIMPLAGKILAGNREAYLHLPESIRMFLPPDEFISILQATGFSHVSCRRLTNGIAMIYSGEKL
jgi:demethylmenaquinone methyltransferase/2-methoxy-6-polyprenyl-1,4-benzoquinol methylase